jgi:hypothetical protein
VHAVLQHATKMLLASLPYERGTGGDVEVPQVRHQLPELLGRFLQTPFIDSG